MTVRELIQNLLLANQTQEDLDREVYIETSDDEVNKISENIDIGTDGICMLKGRKLYW